MYSGACLVKVANAGKYAGLFLLSSIPPILPNTQSANDTNYSQKAGGASKQLFPITANPQTAIEPQRQRIKRTTNRKRITKASTIMVNGETYPINTGKGAKKNTLGIYIPQIEQMISQYQICKARWGRVFVLRQELHSPHITETSKAVTLFNKRLFPKLIRIYNFDVIGFSWCREYHGKGKGIHHHYVLFLDGRKIRHSSKIIPIVREAWEGSSRKDFGYSLGYIKHPFYFVDNIQTEREAIERISYQAKCRGKGHRPPQSKDYACSRIRA